MKCKLMIIAVATVCIPGAAAAGSAYTITHENNVAVYRAAPNHDAFQKQDALQRAYRTSESNANIKAQFAAQTNALRAQQKTLDAIAADVAEQKAILKSKGTTKRRSRYGRSYYGNPRFFGPNGFRDNSNFSGASVPTTFSTQHGRKRGH